MPTKAAHVLGLVPASSSFTASSPLLLRFHRFATPFATNTHAIVPTDSAMLPTTNNQISPLIAILGFTETSGVLHKVAIRLAGRYTVAMIVATLRIFPSAIEFPAIVFNDVVLARSDSVVVETCVSLRKSMTFRT